LPGIGQSSCTEVILMMRPPPPCFSFSAQTILGEHQQIAAQSKCLGQNRQIPPLFGEPLGLGEVCEPGVWLPGYPICVGQENVMLCNADAGPGGEPLRQCIGQQRNSVSGMSQGREAPATK
jgi:hypothetical protein